MGPGNQKRGRELGELATGQHGVVGRRQLLGLGFGEAAIKAQVSSGRLHKLHREVFAVGHRRLSENGRRRAAVLAYGDDAVLSHRSAAALWRLAGARHPVLDVTAPIGRQGRRRRAGIWIHRCKLDPEDRTMLAGVPVTSVARTLFDLAESVPFEQLASAWEEADRLRLLQLAAVERVCERGRGRRALRPVRRLLGAARAPADGRSPLEIRFSAFCDERRIPPPSYNAMALGYEVDALWARQKVVVEADGFAFHSHREAFERDRYRDAELVVNGYRVIRVTDRRLADDGDGLARQLRSMLIAEEPG